MVNLVSPEDEAVKRSPLPELSTTNAANVDAAATEAEGVVPALVDP